MTQGKLKTAAAVLWLLRWDLVAVLLVAAVMMMLADTVPFGTVAQIVPLMGVVVSIFIGFRNSSAYQRWWEARSLWGQLAANACAMSNALVAVDNRTEPMAVVVDRMHRRQVRHAWQLAAELRGVPPAPGVAALTPEDPAGLTATQLLTAQAADIRDLANEDWIDRQGRSLLVNLNSAQANVASGLERIRNQPMPLPYTMFVRAVAWFFAVMVCTRLDPAGHDSGVGIVVSVLVMAMFVVAERLGHFLEKPMTDGPFGLAMQDFCAGITADLLGGDTIPPSKRTESRFESGHTSTEMR